MLVLSLLLAVGGAAQAEEISFSREVAPILQKQCVGCHREGKAKGKYRLDSYKHAMAAIAAGKLEDSELFYRITTEDEDDRMPVEADPLPEEQVATIRAWIEQGAKYDAGDPAALLSGIIPAQPHAAAPATYRRPIPITAMAISGDGKTLFTGGYHEILVWNPQDGQLLRRIAKNGQRTYGLALSPDGRLMAAATGSPGKAGELRIFEAATGAVVGTPVRTDDIALCVAFSPDGGQVAFGAADGKLRVFDTATWKENLVIRAHSDWVNALAWNSDGTQIATASRDKTAKVFDVASAGKRLITFSGHSEAVRGVAFHPGGQEVISCGDHGLLLRWKISDGKKSADLANFGGKPALRLISTAAGYFASADGLAVQFASAGQNRGREFSVGQPAAVITACAVHGMRLFVGTFDGRVIAFDLESGEQVEAFLAAPTIEPVLAESQPAAQDWPSFRGPGASGVADGQGLPEKWDAGSGEGIRFKVAIPGLAHSSPIVWGDRLFLTTAVSSQGKASFKPGLYGDGDASKDRSVHAWKLLCLDKQTGKILWNETAAEGKPKDKRHIKSTYANSTPATDGAHVVALFGSEGLFAYTVEGKFLWKFDLGRMDVGAYDIPSYEWGGASSPIIYDGKVIVQCDQQKGSLILAVDVKTGKQVWRTARDELPSWGTPTVYPGKNRSELVTNGSNFIRGYDPATGEELWRLGGSSKITAPTPVYSDDLIIVASGRHPERPIFAIRPGANGDISLEGDATSNGSVAWSWTRRGGYMPTPLIYRDHVYVLNNDGRFACYGLAGGDEIYYERIPHRAHGFSASPVAADGKIYLAGEDGLVFVVEAGTELKLLAKNPLGEPLMATPALSDGVMYLRGSKHLFAVGK